VNIQLVIGRVDFLGCNLFQLELMVKDPGDVLFAT
jgi:hypothetical protein